MRFGNYYLGQNIKEIRNDLEDISEQMFNSGFIKVFADEKIYKGKRIMFLNAEWNVVLGVTNNKVYKIALQLTTPQQETTLSDNVKAYFENIYGKPDDFKESETSYFYIWDTKEGNTILETGKKIGGDSFIPILNIFVTAGQPVRKKASSFFISGLILVAVLLFVRRFFGDIGLLISLLIIIIFFGQSIRRVLSQFFNLARTTGTGVITVGFVWGIAIAFLLRLFLNVISAGIILSIIGYSIGVYISIPYWEVLTGVNPFLELSIRTERNKKIINLAGIVGFIVASIIFYFLLR